MNNKDIEGGVGLIQGQIFEGKTNDLGFIQGQQKQRGLHNVNDNK